jgi:hypothetical protein
VEATTLGKPWKTMITLNLTEIENHTEIGTKIDKGFTKFCLDEKHNRLEKLVFREVHYADEPKSLTLNYYLMDKDCVAMLKRMYGGDNGSTKQDLVEYGDLLPNFFGCEEKGKEVLEAVDNYTWDMLD